MRLLDIFKKRSQSPPIEKSIHNESIYCKLYWESHSNTIKLYGYNKIHDIELLCSNNLLEHSYGHSTRPIPEIYIPRILFNIDWPFIFNTKPQLLSLTIYFTNYFTSTRIYSVILEAQNMRKKIIRDTFSSTTKLFIDPFELTDNIHKFVTFAENYK